jgi:O-antigen/teichoic acid export membrane protein
MEVITIVSRITFPTYSRIQEDKARLKRWLEKSTHLMSIIYFPAVTGLLVTSGSILQYLYADKSDKWLPALPALLWFLTAALPVIVTTTYTNALYALGYPKVVLKLMILYTLMTWAIGLPLLYFVGFSGIAITVCLITYLTFPLVIHYMNRVVRIDTAGSVIRPFIASALMAAAIFVLNRYFVDSLLTLAAAITAGAVLYAGLIWALDGRFLKEEVKNILTHSLKRG